MKKDLTELKKKNLQIIGVSGAEGSSIALFLIDLGCLNLVGHDFSTAKEFPKKYLTYHDQQSEKVSLDQIKKIKANLKINYKDHYLNQLDQADLIFAPSSWFRYPINFPLKLYDKRKMLWNWYNLIIKNFPGKIIGVTGTAGKGTTVNLIYQILKTAKNKVWLAGDSWQTIDFKKIFSAPANSYLVAELSNRTLTFAKNSKKSPDLAIITNITKNHLDDHHGKFKNYLETKLEICKYQTKKDFVFINQDDQISRNIKNYGLAKKIYFSQSDKLSNLIKNSHLQAPHLKSDAIAAIKIASLLKINLPAVKKAIVNFKPRSGRLESLGKYQKILFINDGASTRPTATNFAIKSFPKGKVLLIIQGSRKFPDQRQFTDLAETIKKYQLPKVAISGEIKNYFVSFLDKFKIDYQVTNSLTESFNYLFSQAKPGQIILLSPASESFGEFRDYRERIIRFNQLFKKLKNG